VVDFTEFKCFDLTHIDFFIWELISYIDAVLIAEWKKKAVSFIKLTALMVTIKLHGFHDDNSLLSNE
jgi:hypothetical protein